MWDNGHLENLSIQWTERGGPKYILQGQMAGLSKGICLPLPFPQIPGNGRKDTHVTTTIKQERMWSADQGWGNSGCESLCWQETSRWKGYWDGAPWRRRQKWLEQWGRGCWTQAAVSTKDRVPWWVTVTMVHPFQVRKAAGGGSQQRSIKYQKIHKHRGRYGGHQPLSL